MDVTANVKLGDKMMVNYRGLFNGKELPDNAGNIAMSSYLVVYE